MNKLQDLIHKYIYNTRDPLTSYNLAKEYENIQQYGSALSYYLKAAELADHPQFEYEVLVRIALVFKHQGGRAHSEVNSLLQAIPLQPDKPEAYYLLADAYYRKGDHKEAMFILKLGRDKKIKIPLWTDVEFVEYGFDLLEILVGHFRSQSGYSTQRIQEILHKYELKPEHKQQLKDLATEYDLGWPE